MTIDPIIQQDSSSGRLPKWMKAHLPTGEKYSRVKNLVAVNNLHTICVSGNCPNKGECWSAGTASFMILGDKCTRNCRFCAVKNMRPRSCRLGRTNETCRNHPFT